MSLDDVGLELSGGHRLDHYLDTHHDRVGPSQPCRSPPSSASGAASGFIGFGGPPTHIALLRKLCVEERLWPSAPEFEDGISATNLLPGPASTQLAMLCAWRLRGRVGALIGGICFIVPGLVITWPSPWSSWRLIPRCGSKELPQALVRRCPLWPSTPPLG